MVRTLTPEQDIEYRRWAQLYFKPGKRISPLWHPVVKDECNKINIEWNKKNL